MKRWLRWGIKLGGSMLVLQLAVRIYLYLWPKVTPPLVAFLLDSRIRRLYRNPVRTLAPLQLGDGETVLEIGSGTGTFTLVGARQVSPHGKLIGIELQSGMIRTLLPRVRQAATTNIVIQRANALALPLSAACVDAAYLIAVLPMTSNRQHVLREVRRVLKPGGRLLISEEVIAPEYVPPFVTQRWGRQAGFMVVHTMRGFWAYSILFRKPKD